MFENWRKLVSTEKIIALFLRITILHEIKQNEKYPYASFFHQNRDTDCRGVNCYSILISNILSWQVKPDIHVLTVN